MRRHTPTPPGTVTTYTCPKHPEVVRDEPGSCVICGTELQEVDVPAGHAPATPGLNRGTTTTPAGAGRSIRERAQIVAMMVALSVAALALAIGDTALGAVLPVVRRDLGMSLLVSVWVVNGFSVALASLLLIGGRLTDERGARRAFMWGAAIMLVGSAAAGLAPTAAMLIPARVVQGIGGALLMPSSLAMITQQFRSRSGAAIGVWAGVSALGLAAGPLIGAMIATSTSWRWVFLANVPAMALCLLTARSGMPPSTRRPSRGPFDLRGLVSFAFGIVLVIAALTEAERDAASARVVGLLAAGVVALVIFVRTERRHPAPLLDMRLLRDRNVRAANVVSLLSTAVMCGIFYFVAIYLQELLSYSTIAAARTLLPLTVAIVVLGPISGFASDRLGCRLPAAIGLLMLAAGLWGMASLGTSTLPPLLMPSLLLAGIGIGLATPPMTAAGLAGAAPEDAGIRAGLLNTSRTLGLAIGVALTGAITSVHLASTDAARIGDPDGFVLGLGHAFQANAVISLIAAAIAATALRGRTRTRPVPLGANGNSSQWSADNPGSPTALQQRR